MVDGRLGVFLQNRCKLRLGDQSVCTTCLDKGQAFELIREDGKKEVLGRPNLYVTTDYFLDYMGINHLEELPVVTDTELVAEESQLFGQATESELE